MVPKGNPAPGATSIAFKEAKIAYKTHVQTYGWMSKVHDGETAGTSGKAKRMEALNIAMVDSSYNKEISYRTHVQTYGWQKWVNGGKNSGTEGKAKRLEAIQIELKDSLADQYDIYYRCMRRRMAGLAGQRTEKRPERKVLQKDWKLFRSYWWKKVEQHLEVQKNIYKEVR